MLKNETTRQVSVKIEPGARFGRLVVLNDHGYKRVECLCDCAALHTTARYRLRRGLIRSCGCLARDMLGLVNRKHGGSKSLLYHTWVHMRDRCENPRSKAFQWYGGRGIAVCDRWRTSFEAFRDDMGEKPSPKHSIDRIDNNRGYSPENCRWATRKEQMANTRTIAYMELDGVRRRVSEWVEITGIRRGTLDSRRRRGWTESRVLTTPLRVWPGASRAQPRKHGNHDNGGDDRQENAG